MKKQFIFALAALTLCFAACKDKNEPEQTTPQVPVGALKGVFSVSADKKVYFSQGNLQYQAKTSTSNISTFRFAENQYDFLSYQDNEKISSTNTGWIDLFGWGTSGYNSRFPYLTSENYQDYGDRATDIAGTNYDWGVYNKISNGGDQKGLWRTLTKDEWQYLLDTRANAANLRGQATVNAVHGYLLLPDNWKTPDGITFTPQPNDGNWTTNVYSLEEWNDILVPTGAVFLPCGGRRLNTTTANESLYGYYWASTCGGSQFNADYLLFSKNDAHFYYGGNGYSRYYGCSVRLVQDVK